MKRKREHFFHFWLVYVVEEKKSYSRKRESNFSLEFPVIGSSVSDETRSKVALRSKGYVWASVLGSFDKIREGRCFLLLDLIFI